MGKPPGLIDNIANNIKEIISIIININYIKMEHGKSNQKFLHKPP